MVSDEKLRPISCALYGRTIVVGSKDDPVTTVLADQLLNKLTYFKLVRMTPDEAFEAYGSYRKVGYRREPHRFATMIADGQIVLPIGAWNHGVNAAREVGYSFRVDDDRSPKAVRPKRYLTRWQSLRREYQLKDTHDSALRAIAGSYCGGVINAVPAVGKGYLICAVAMLFPNARIVVTSKRVDVCEILYERLLDYGIDAGLKHGKKKASQKLLDKRVLVCAGLSLHYAGERDLVLVDEMHEWAAPSLYEKLIDFAANAVVVGFSGSVETHKKDDTDRILQVMFGGELWKLGWASAMERGTIVPIHVRVIPTDRNDYPTVSSSASKSMMKQTLIWNNRPRNEQIAEICNHHRNELGLVLVDTVEHALALKQLLPHAELFHGEVDAKRAYEFRARNLCGIDHKFLTTQDRTVLRQKFEDGKIPLMISTEAGSTGLSNDELEYLVESRAAVNGVVCAQGPGRTCRVDGKKDYGVVYRLADTFHPYFERKCNAACQLYKSFNWTVQRGYKLPMRQ